MEYLATYGVCLAVFLGSVVYETRRMKKEEQKTRDLLKNVLHSQDTPAL